MKKENIDPRHYPVLEAELDFWAIESPPQKMESIFNEQPLGVSPATFKKWVEHGPLDVSLSDWTLEIREILKDDMDGYYIGQVNKSGQPHGIGRQLF